MLSVSDVMSSPVETIAPDATIVETARYLREKDIGSVIVVEDGDPVGIVTETDLVDVLAARRDGDALTAGDCMSASLVTVDADASIVEAAALFRAHRIKKLPVLDDDALVGIVTTTTLSYYFPHTLREEAEPEGEHPDRHARERVDTAYEREEWSFESLGEHDDRIELGDVVRFSKTLSKSDVDAFAEASGDTNRLHLDEEYARGTRFGRVIVHGTLVAGVVSAALARLPGLIVYLSQETSYLAPVDVGSEVTAVCEVLERIGDDRYRLRTTVHDDEGEEVLDGEATVIADPIPDTA